MRRFIYFLLATLINACTQITIIQAPNCNKTLVESYQLFERTIVGQPKWTVLELYRDGSFMFAGDLSPNFENRMFCLKGFYKKKEGLIKLRETYRNLTTDMHSGYKPLPEYKARTYKSMKKYGENSQFSNLSDVYLFHPIDSLGVLNLYADEKGRYKILHIFEVAPHKAAIGTGLIRMSGGNLKDSISIAQPRFLEKIDLQKSIFNCQCPTENLFPIYQKLFPEDAKKRHGRMPK